MTFASTATGYSPYVQCSEGTSTNTAFPAAGSSVSWTCRGYNGGANDNCSASRAASTPSTITVSGRIYNQSTGQGYGNVGFNSGGTCGSMPAGVRTDANGNYSFQVPYSTTNPIAYCIRPDMATPANTTGPVLPKYVAYGMTTQATYEAQLAGMDCHGGTGCGYGSTVATYDLNNPDTGMDFVFTNTAVPTNGTCGTANGKTYPATATGYAPDTQCSVGTSTNTAFPAAGSSVSWTCRGYNGGANDNCSASRAASTPSTVTVSGRIYNQSTGQGYGNVGFNSGGTCGSMPAGVRTDANGNYSFQVPYSTTNPIAYCIRPDMATPANTTGPVLPKYAAFGISMTTYEMQVAGMSCHDGGSGCGLGSTVATYDLNNPDTGMDFVFTNTPSLPPGLLQICSSCTSGAELFTAGNPLILDVGAERPVHACYFADFPKENCNGQDVSGLAGWSPSNQSIATITRNASSATTKGIAQGTITGTATYQSSSASFGIQVNQQANVTVSGRIYNQSTGQGYGNISFAGNAADGKCGSMPAGVRTDANGNYSFQVPYGIAYCIRPNFTAPANTTGPVLPKYAAYGISMGTYEMQLAGMSCHDGGSGCGLGSTVATYDLNNPDTGMDFVFTNTPHYLSICSNRTGGCNSGVAPYSLFRRISLVQGQTEDIVACYNTTQAGTCNGTDVTVATAFSTGDSGIASITKVGSVARVKGESGNTTIISATYAPPNSSSLFVIVPVSVQGCVCDSFQAGNYCEGKTYADSCGQSVCPGNRKNCGADWREVAP